MMMMMLALVLCLLAVGSSVGVKDGADIYFNSNIEEMLNTPIVFEKPPPSWLKGTLIRNGLGRFEVGDRKFINALDGFGKLASWKFSGNGSAYFSTRMVYSKSYNESLASNDIAPYLMLDRVDPAFDLIQELTSFKNGPDNMNVNILNFGSKTKNEFVVMSDYWNVYSIDPYTLKTIEEFHPPLPGVSSFESAVVLGTAHPLPEYGTDNYLTFASIASPLPELKSKFIFTRTKSAGDREVIATIEVDKVSYMHSFAVTEHYAILFAVPFYIDPIAMLKNFQPVDAFEWLPDGVTMLYVINLKTGAVKTLRTENMFFMHVVNAYESELFDNEIVVDICTFRNISSLHQMDIKKLHDPTLRGHGALASLKRYTLDLSNSDVNVYNYEPTSDIPYINHFDFPTINENYRYKKYCYAYGVVYGYDRKDYLDMALVKKDLCNGKNEKSWVNPNLYFNEAFFVERPGATAEDDGVLILPILDVDAKRTNITIVNATDFTIISSGLLPTNIPAGTHGHFFDYIV